MIQRTRILTKRYWDGSSVFIFEDTRTVPYSPLAIFLQNDNMVSENPETDETWRKK